MSFLSPWFLFGLLGIGIPIAIHLIRREKAVKIPFSAVRFLKKAPKKSTFTHRFQQWLLMVMRIAIVALLAVAFARPFLSGTASEWIGPAPESAVILLDTSMSMGYGDHFHQPSFDTPEPVYRSTQPRSCRTYRLRKMSERIDCRPENSGSLPAPPVRSGWDNISAHRFARMMRGFYQHDNDGRLL